MKRLLPAALLAISLGALAQYPQRPIQLIVPWGAGGGTDATARILGALLESELKQPVIVANRAGGSGVVGQQAIASAQADGYTIGMITVEIAMMHHVGLTPMHRHDHGRDRHDASRWAHPAQAHRLHADRAGERRSGRHYRARRFAL